MSTAASLPTASGVPVTAAVTVPVMPALLLTDYEMPELDGERLIERVRVHHPHLPILVLTSRAVDDARREAERLGVIDYLYKPIDLDVLLGRISAALDEGWSSSPKADRSAAAR